MTQPLGGLSVLIVEDEVIIGMMLFNEINRAGGTPLGPARSVAGAMEEIESRNVETVILDASSSTARAPNWPASSKFVKFPMSLSAATTKSTCRLN
jgi:hypothetical protein